MHCKHPICTKNTAFIPVPCGQCLDCRINNRRIKTHRMMLEASSHTHNSFLTLTYNDENLPKEFHNEKTGQIYEENSVNPRHHKLFIDRLRTDYKRKTGKEIRYFACAEYGEKTARPHYHYALFGFPTCLNLNSRKQQKAYKPCECTNCKFISKHWSYGHIFLGDITQHSVQYVAGYVTKKLTADTTTYQKNILQGRHPEFSRCSLRPALGKEAFLKHIRSIAKHIETPEDIPRVLIHNKKKWAIGRYLYEQALIETGLDNEEKTPSQIDRKNHDTVLLMFKDKKLDDNQKKILNNGTPWGCATIIEQLNAQRSLNLEKKHEYQQYNRKGI